MPYKIYKQFIPTGQPIDPPDAQRDVFVLCVTSGSYTGSNLIYSDLKSTLLGEDQLELDDQIDYKGWGVLGNGRLFIEVKIDKDGNPIQKLTKEKIEKEKEYKKTKKLKPTIVSFYPPSGSIGDNFMISGSDLFGTVEIDFNGGLYIIDDIDTENPDNQHIYITVPTGSTTGKVTVLNYDGKDDKTADDFIVI
jgi:hypothetical protein